MVQSVEGASIDTRLDRYPVASITESELSALKVREPIFKRPLDLFLACLGLIATFPIWVVCAVGVWLEDRGPVFFRQDRIGRFGRPFRVLKFRSMIHDPKNIEVQAREDDPRITRVGRMLRRTALDELPQLWNILVGEMSFVGPRAQPEREIIRVADAERELWIREIPGFAVRQLVRPGLTGIAQLYAPRAISHRQKFRYDLVYVKRALVHRLLEQQKPGQPKRVRGAVVLLGGDLRLLVLDVALILRSLLVALKGNWQV